jgi:hypothetical protein
MPSSAAEAGDCTVRTTLSGDGTPWSKQWSSKQNFLSARFLDAAEQRH